MPGRSDWWGNLQRDEAMRQAIITFIIPVLAPLVAAIALVVGLRGEFRKVRAQHDHDRRQRAESVFTELFYATALCDLVIAQLGGGAPKPETLTELRASFERIFTKLMAEPAIGDHFHDHVKFVVHSGQRARMFLMLAEARVRAAQTQITRKDLLLVYLTLLTLTYLYESDEQRRHSETYQAIELIYQSDPQHFKLFVVDRTTPCLRTTAGRLP